MYALSQILYVIDSINEWMGKVFGFLSLVLMGVVLYDTIMRYAFNAPTIWGMDMNKILLLIVVCLGGGYCFLHGGHVKVDVLYVNLSQRTRALIDLVTNPIVILFCIVVVKYGGAIFWEAFTSGEVSSDSAWEYLMWPVLILVPIAGTLLGLQSLAKWIRDLVIVVTGENRLRSKVFSGEGGLR
jgi:TRAP-type mannitol/chloroaromatic compound transport system permease small subunit